MVLVAGRRIPSSSTAITTRRHSAGNRRAANTRVQIARDAGARERSTLRATCGVISVVPPPYQKPHPPVFVATQQERRLGALLRPQRFYPHLLLQIRKHRPAKPDLCRGGRQGRAERVPRRGATEHRTLAAHRRQQEAD